MTEERAPVQQARQGGEEAFAALVEQNQGHVYHLALRMMGGPDDAAELCQEALLNAWKDLGKFQGESFFSTWLYRLISNMYIDFLRRKKRRSTLSMTVSLDGGGGARQAELPDKRCSPHCQAEQQGLRNTLRAGLRVLSEEHRQVLILRELEGLSYGEIAALLGVEEGTIKSRIVRARLAPRKYLLEQGNFFDSPPSEMQTRSAGRKGGGGMLTCEQALKLISAQLDGALTAEEAGALDEHLA